MPAKIALSKVIEVLQKEKIEGQKLRSIVEALNLASQPDQAGENEPACKKQFVFLSAPADEPGQSSATGWVLQLPESESPHTAEDRVRRAAQAFNTTKKGRLLPVKSLAEALENVPTRLFKEEDVWVKTKTAVYTVALRQSAVDLGDELPLDR